MPLCGRRISSALQTNSSASGIRFPVPNACVRVYVRPQAGRERALGGALRAPLPNAVRLFCATNTQANVGQLQNPAHRSFERLGGPTFAKANPESIRGSSLRFALRSKRRLERMTRLELATSTLARWMFC